MSAVIIGVDLASGEDVTVYTIHGHGHFKVRPRFYLASCDHCGWIGSSEECGTDSGPSGDSDVYCPRCRRPGADCGKIACAAEASERQALSEARGKA